MSEKSARDRPDDARPMCKYGTDCYRKNPVHFEEYRHPGKVLSLSYNFIQFFSCVIKLHLFTRSSEYTQFVCCDLSSAINIARHS